MSSYKTADYDILSIRTIRAINPSTNLVHPAYTALMSDGIGGSMWSTLSTQGEIYYPFQIVSTSAKAIVADSSQNTIRFINADGILFSSIESSTFIYAHAFQNISVQNQEPISFSSLRFSTSENFAFSTTNSALFFQIPDTFLNSIPLRPTTYITGTNGVRIQYNEPMISLELSSFSRNGFVALQDTMSSMRVTLPSTLTGYYPSKATYFSTSIHYVSTQSGLGIQTLLANNTSTETVTFSSFTNYSTDTLSTTFNAYSSTLRTLLQSTQTYTTSSLSTFSGFTSTLLDSLTLASTNRIFGELRYFSSATESMSSFQEALKDYRTIASTQISLYNLKAKTTDFLSSSKGLQAQITAFPAQTISTLSRQLSTFSTTFTSTAKGFSQSTGRYISLHSTIPFVTYINSPQSLGRGFNLTLSTAEINLSSLSSFIHPETQIFLDYEPSFCFRNYQIYLSDTTFSKNTFPVCTFLQMGTSTVPGTLFRDQIQSYIDISNSYFSLPPYSRHIRFEIPRTYITSSPLVFTHILNNAAFINMGVSSRNQDGGIIQVDSFYENCAHEITSQTSWSNFTNPSTSVSLYIQNALLS